MLRRVKIVIVSFLVFFVVLVLISYFYNRKNMREQYLTAAAENARALFTEIVATRRWDSIHGGVYMVVSKTVRPNPYLDIPDRDIVTTKGVKLTKINPAYMTRMISEVLKKDRSVEFHITSDRPLNKGNMADSWEIDAISKFAKGDTELYTIEEGERIFFRYMAPLITEESCLKCHRKQGYNVGDIRGGISIRLPFESYIKSMEKTGRNILLIHVFFSVIILIVTVFLGRMLLHSLSQVISSREKIKTLSGMLPICSSCKKVRDDRGYWNQVEQYIERHSEAEFSHSICPECMEKLYGDEDWFDEAKEENPGLFDPKEPGDHNPE